jgi:uncharacterized protein (TIRG00374 family)
MGKLRTKLNIIISTILLAVFVYLAFRNVNLGELFVILRNTNYLYIFIGSIIGVVLGSIVRAYRWKYLLAPVKTGISFRNLLSATVIGYMVNNLIPRSGEVVRPYLLGRDEKISRAATFGTIIIERIVDTVMFLLFFGLALIYFKNRILKAFPEIDFAIILLTVLIFIVLFWVLFTMFRTKQSLSLFKFFTKRLPLKYQEKLDRIFNSLVNGFDVLKKPELIIKIAFWSGILWLVYLASTFIPFYSFGIMTGNGISLWDSLWNANLLLVLINVSMFIPSPAATGPYHYVCKVTLVSIFYINEAQALGYATSTHIMNFLIFFAAGLYYFITSNYKISELKGKTI